MELQNKVALITGGTHGIGAETALRLAQQGVKICLAARHVEMTTIRQELDAIDADYHMIQADLSTEQECVKVVLETVDFFGSLDIIIHAAGAAAPGGLLSGAHLVWSDAFDLHLHAIFHLCRTAVPFMQKSDEGAIILLGSAAGLRGVKNALAYAVVKGAVPQFTRALAFELSDWNIRVNCVSPGIIRTRFQDYLSAEQVKNNLENRIPLRREGTSRDVAEAIEMLVKNEFITGENIVIDGGMSMRIV